MLAEERGRGAVGCVEEGVGLLGPAWVDVCDPYGKRGLVLAGAACLGGSPDRRKVVINLFSKHAPPLLANHLKCVSCHVAGA